MKKVTALVASIWLALAAGAPAQQRQPADSDIQVGGKPLLAALVSLAESHITTLAVTLETVAASDEARSGDWPAIKPLLAVVEKGGIQSTVWFVQPDGSYFTVSGDRIEAQNLKDRPYFPRAMAGEATFAELVVSRSTARNSAVTVVPIRKGGRVVGALGASIFLDRLSERIARDVVLPPDMFFYALEASGQTALHSRTEKIFRDPSREGSPTLAKAVERMRSAPAGVVSYEYEGRQRVALYQTSKLTGWYFVLGRIIGT